MYVGAERIRFIWTNDLGLGGDGARVSKLILSGLAEVIDEANGRGICGAEVCLQMVEQIRRRALQALDVGPSNDGPVSV